MGMDTTNNHLTEGNIIYGLTALAGPMFISALLQNAQSLIDLYWVGRLGSDAVAALALSGTILMLLFPVIMGMSAGTVAFVSRHIGAKETEEASHVAGQSLLVSMIAGLVTGVIGWASARNLCILLGADPVVVQIGADYLGISFLGCFTIFMLFIGNSILNGAGNAIVPMSVMILANILNIILDPLFIFGYLGFPCMGVRGAAVATIIAQAVALIVILFFLIKGTSGIKLGIRELSLKPVLACKIFLVGFPGAMQMLSRSLMSLVLMRLVAMAGTAAIAAYGIGLRFLMICLMPAFAIGNSTATMVGQNLGANQPQRAQTAAWAATAAGILIMGSSAVILYIWGPLFISKFNKAPEVISIGTQYLHIVSPSFIFAVIAIILGRAFQGAGDTMPPMILTIICLWGLQVPLAIFLFKTCAIQTNGIWYAVAIATATHGVMTAAWFQVGKWKRKTLP